MAQCPYCGAQNSNTKFCGQCGSQLAPTAPVSQAPRTNRTPWIIAGVAGGLVLLLGLALVFALGGSGSGSVRTVSGPSGVVSDKGAPAPSGGGSGQKRLPSDPNNPLVGGYIHIRVPGAAYTQQAGDTVNLYVSSGAMTTSSLLINADGTYAWNSQWDGKIITGTWVKEAGGDLTLKKGQEGKDWRVTKSTETTGGDVVIMDGSIWYIADRAKE